MQPLFPISPRARTYIWQICIHVYLHRSNLTSSCWHDSNAIPPNVSAVTNTRGPGKWRDGALSLEKITFKAQKRVHADGVLRHRSGPLFSLQPQPSEWNGSGVGESHRRVLFICWRVWPAAEGLITPRRRYVPPQRTPDHRDLSRFSWRTCDRFWITPRLPRGARGRAEKRRLLRHLWISTLTFPLPLQCSFHALELSLFWVYRPSMTTHCKNKTCGLLNNIKSGRNDYCPPRNPVNVSQEKWASSGGLGRGIYKSLKGG